MPMVCLLMVACMPKPTPMAAPTLPDHPQTAEPIRHVATHFVLPDGHSLAGRVWQHPQPQRLILGVHGYNDYSKAFEPVARYLSGPLAATVYAYDQRGFGANPQPGIWPGADTLLADLRQITAQLRQQHPGLPITVVGESMGGALVWLASAESPGLAADQIILKAPAVWGEQSMPWYQRISLQFMYALAPDMTFTGQGAQSLGITPTDDVEVSRELGRDPLFIKATRVSSLMGVTALMGRAQNLHASAPQRSLVLYGLRDRIIPPAPVCDWLSQLNDSAATRKPPDFVIYPEGWHLLTRQLRTREVIEDMRLWIAQEPVPRQQNHLQARSAVCVRP